jgi:hypothetical protein
VPANFTAADVAELIAYVDASNASPEADTIALAPGTTYTLTQASGWLTGLGVGAAGGGLTIVGNGDTIQRSGTAAFPEFRLFQVGAGASLSLANLTLQGGAINQRPTWDARGGAIYSEGSLSLFGVTVQNNTVRGQDGVSLGGVPEGGGSSFPGQDAAGGGIYSTGILSMVDCTIRDNAAIAGGAGTQYRADGGSAFGGGLAIAGGTATISGSTIAGNSARGGEGSGGDPYHPSSGGGDAFGGGLSITGGTVSITTSLFDRNTAQGGVGGRNRAGYAGGDGGDGVGGGVYATLGTAEFHQVTITVNNATGGLGGKSDHNQPPSKPGKGVGGGLYIDDNADVGLDQFTVDHVKKNDASTSDNNIRGAYHLIS